MRGFQNLDVEYLLGEEAKKVHFFTWVLLSFPFLIYFLFLNRCCMYLWNQILHDIMYGKIEEDPSLLLRFLVISFADLKNWKIYYSVAFPSLVFKSEMTLLNLHSASLVLSQAEVMILCT